MTYREWRDKIQRNADCLIGRRITNTSIGALLEEVLRDVIKHPFSVKDGCVVAETANFNISILGFYPSYNTDKRKSIGYGDRITKIEVRNLERSPPNDLDMENLTQYVDYEYAKFRKHELLSDIKELKQELTSLEDAVEAMDEIMKVNAYPDREN